MKVFATFRCSATVYGANELSGLAMGVCRKAINI